MSSVIENTSGLVTYLAKNIVDDVDSVSIETIEGENGDIEINIRVADEDMGHVIGKDGHIIKSIRTLARACATKADVHVDVEVLD